MTDKKHDTKSGKGYSDNIAKAVVKEKIEDKADAAKEKIEDKKDQLSDAADEKKQDLERDVKQQTRKAKAVAAGMPADSFLHMDTETGDPVFNLTVDSQKAPDAPAAAPVNFKALESQAYAENNTLAIQLAKYAESVTEDLTAAVEANNIYQRVIGDREATISDLGRQLQEKESRAGQLAIV